MKTEDIKHLFSEFEDAASEIEGVECWSARELQALLGYSKWENFEKVILKAKDACANAGENIPDHFPVVRKTIPMPKGAPFTSRGIILLGIGLKILIEHLHNNEIFLLSLLSKRLT
jgi:DNA-damage-inducible protein D